MNPAPDATVETVVTVANPTGLHLRTGKEVVRLASGFSAEIRASNLTRPPVQGASVQVNVKSILQLMQLQAQCGHQLHIIATGSDAQEALTALAAFIANPSPQDHPQPTENSRHIENQPSTESQRP